MTIAVSNFKFQISDFQLFVWFVAQSVLTGVNFSSQRVQLAVLFYSQEGGLAPLSFDGFDPD